MKRSSSEYQLLTGIFFRLLPYQILLLIINAANSIVDSLCASNFVGQEAMTAMGLYAPMDHFLYAISIMLVSGSQLLCGKFMGRNQREAVEGIFSVDLLVAGVIGLVTTLVLGLSALTDMTRFLFANTADRMVFNRYLTGQSLGLPALIMGQQLFAFLSMENQKKRTMIASVCCIATNAVLDLVLIAVLKLGTLGLGLASATSMWVFFAVQAQYYMSGKSDLRFSFKGADFRQIAQIFRRGYSDALSRFVEMFRAIIVNMLILQFVGSVGLSSFAAVNSVMAVLWPVIFGMLAVMRMLLSISIGEEDHRSVVNIIHIAIRYGLLIATGIAAVLFVLAEPLTCMFFRDPADPIYRMTISAFRILPWCMPFSIISLDMAGYAQAMEKKFLSIVLPILDGAVFVVAFSLILIPSFGMNGLYIANVLNGLMCCLFILFYAWHVRKHFPRSLEDILDLPADFGTTEDQRIDISVRSMSEVTNVSKQVIAFCRERSIDEHRSTFAGLALEEMAGNIVQHGFSHDHKHHSIDIRVTHKGDDVILRMRDNCIAFNPSDAMKLMEPEDITRHVGFRIVCRIAKDIRYQNLLGLNVLTIRFPVA